MNKLKNIKHKKSISVITIILLLGLFLIPRLGNWLVAEDDLSHSDMIIVLMGSVPDRILEAVDIHDEGYSDKIVMVNSNMIGYDVLIDRGVEIPGQAQLTYMAANLLGVSEEDLRILPGEARSTQDEAVIAREFLRENKDINSVILVTSKFHSSRSKKIFTKALEGLDREVTLISRPSKYDNYNPKDWWRDREDVQSVVTEYLKLFNFYFIEQFQL